MKTNIETAQGWVAGESAATDPAMRVFRGLPYAQPPLGDLRWKPPQPVEPWTDLHAADAFSLPCWQTHSEDAFVWSRGVFERSEDCLYLNVWSPEDADHLPVMVWFHGGAHTGGWGHNLLFDGTNLAGLGVVLVTINYRLGPWGFLAHPLLSEESPFNSSGNYGLLDKIAALKWVQQNIEAFGGDASNVTVFGQSAGSQSICALMASPLAQGLFHKAIGQSASCLGSFASDPDGFTTGKKLVAALAEDISLEQLRAVSNEQLLEAALATNWANRSRITIDGWVLPEPPVNSFVSGEAASIPLLLGCLANEGHLLFPRNDSLTATQFDNYLNQTFSSAENQHLAIKRAYAEELQESPGLAQHAIATDLFMALGMRQWANFNSASGQPSFLYFMDHIPPASRIYLPESAELELPGGPHSAGAYHSGDLAYVFNNLDKAGAYWSQIDQELAVIMSRYWTNFARNGHPNCEDLPVWQAYAPEQHTTMLLNASPGSRAGVRQVKLDALQAAL
ncbi:MAG: carboxylesterase family protein [Gammaproteobacteria bacterium]|nr:carboxylesterase family protein [Gammaproteobacteria bacterium]MBT5202438.1 carboxylesterase family protein [Gammaproteobacteria bacterium]MBT5603693.1 carboxylesterase family protein [Gammaproteobacteria bacterium]MBT6243781.1 carboxylesterase family protein [Gammaproteobacteria bacterium]